MTIAKAEELYRTGSWAEGHELLQREIAGQSDAVEAARAKLAMVAGANNEDWSRGLHNQELKHRLLDEVDEVFASHADEHALLAAAAFHRGMALHIDFVMAADTDSFDRERESFQRAAQLYEAVGDEDGAAFATAMHGIFYHVDLLDRETARPLLQKAFDMAPRDRATYGKSEAARHLGQIQQELGDPSGALAMLEESYRQREDSGHVRGLPSALHALASARLDDGDLEGAARDLARAREHAERWDAAFPLALIAKTEADLQFAQLAPGVWRRARP